MQPILSSNKLRTTCLIQASLQATVVVLKQNQAHPTSGLKAGSTPLTLTISGATLAPSPLPAAVKLLSGLWLMTSSPSQKPNLTSSKRFSGQPVLNLLLVRLSHLTKELSTTFRPRRVPLKYQRITKRNGDGINAQEIVENFKPMVVNDLIMRTLKLLRDLHLRT